MSFHDSCEKLGVHGKDLWATIGKVGAHDKALADELTKEFEAFLQTMVELLDEWRKELEH